MNRILTSFAFPYPFAFATAFLLACTVNATNSGSSSGGPQGPVSSSPLTGTVDGRPFTAKSAIATKGSTDGKKHIDIYDVDATCDSRPPLNDGSREIILSAPWQTSASADFSLQQTATFVVEKGGSSDNLISTSGRIEVVNAPSDVGSKGTLRIRATFESNNVEGQIDVTVCE